MAKQNTDRAHLIAKVNSILQDNVAAGGLSAAIASTYPASFQFRAGHADIIKDEPMKSTHLFGIGSITKVFVAVVIFQLVEEGKLGLLGTVGKHLGTEVCRDIDNAEMATIEQLLSHRAGIDSWEDDPSWIIHGRGKAMEPTHIWGKTEPLDYLRRPKITAPSPGNWYYSNTNYTLLGLIIEKVTHNTAEAEIRRRILQPLDMKHTFLEGFEESSLENVPCRYHLATAAFRETAGICPAFPQIRDDLIEVTGSNLSASWLAGGMVSSASDLLKFAFALRDGKLLKPATMAVMQHWRPATRGAEMGHGLFRMKLPGKGTWLGHFGGVLGFTAGLWWQEEGDCVICVLANVGKSHAGDVQSGVNSVVLESDFLAIASQLVTS